jgi:hypothetical protein
VKEVVHIVFRRIDFLFFAEKAFETMFMLAFLPFHLRAFSLGNVSVCKRGEGTVRRWSGEWRVSCAPGNRFEGLYLQVRAALAFVLIYGDIYRNIVVFQSSIGMDLKL